MAGRRLSGWGWMAGKLVLAAGLVTIAWQMPSSAVPDRSALSRSAGPKPNPVSRPAAAQPSAARPRFLINSALDLDRPLQHGEYAWADDGVPAGGTWIHIDIARQVIRVMRGTSEIGRAIILYGADDKPTPLGTFSITEKDKDHVSNLYHVPMPYMLRLTDDGIAIHGSTVEYGVATHGCIGVPDEFAALLFAEAKLGTPVMITNRRT